MSEEHSTSPETVAALPGKPAGAFSRQSSEQRKSPQLSHRGLTIMLSVMCLIPVATIAALWSFLPAVHEGELEAQVFAEELPTADYYSVDYYKRPPYTAGVLVIQNKSDQDWTHLNIQVNGNYQVYDTEPILARGEKRYQLSKFLNRTGARFSLQYNELNRVRIYARRPTKDRATFYHEFPVHFPAPTNYWPAVILLSLFAILMTIAGVLFARVSSANRIADKAQLE